MLLVTVIHGTSDRAVQTQRSCVGPPQVLRVALLENVEGTGPPVAGKLNVLRVTAYGSRPVPRECSDPRSASASGP